jgi:hypothetical protein
MGIADIGFQEEVLYDFQLLAFWPGCRILASSPSVTILASRIFEQCDRIKYIFGMFGSIEALHVSSFLVYRP